MPSMSEFSPSAIRLLHDAGALVLLGLTLVPVYLLFNHYWQSLILLCVLYGGLSLLCMRLGRALRRAIRRLPAEIPPWTGTMGLAPTLSLEVEKQHRSLEALQSVRKDPHYVQEVLKPRVQELIAYRLGLGPHAGLEALDRIQLARLDAVLCDFLQRREDTTLWARYGKRQRRVQDVLEILRRTEAL